MFIVGGILFISLGFFLRNKHQQFMNKCITISGIIIDIVEKTQIRRNSVGGIVDKTVIQTPIVQYKYNKLYEFQSEVDANSHYLKNGASVEVLIDPLKPKVAKLVLGAKDNTMFFMLMIGLGIFLSIIGIGLFDPNDFSFDFLEDPILMLVIIFSLGFLYFKILPIISMLGVVDLYTENAKEVED